jgi:DNA-binding transcriptional ArsR family regulator
VQAGPNIARIASLIGERGRAQILSALMSGRALTATELANAAGVTRPTASSHLAKLEQARLIAVETQGRHRYFRLASTEVAELLEGLMGAAQQISSVLRTGPTDPGLRKARLCYDHLAGELAVLIYEGLQHRRALLIGPRGLMPSDIGWHLLGRVGVDRVHIESQRRSLCRACLDWSERRHHLAGAVGAALMTRFIELRWAKRREGSRVVNFSPAGERALREALLSD